MSWRRMPLLVVGAWMLNKMEPGSVASEGRLKGLAWSLNIWIECMRPMKSLASEGVPPNTILALTI